MILLLDVGNTRVKWLAVGEAGLVVARGYLATSAGRETWAASLSGVLPATPASVHASVVAGPLVESSLAALVQDLFGLPISFVRSAASWGELRSGYEDPGRLGVDRWLAMIGARIASPGALLVVDAGTAMTIDAIRTDGLHLGGYIVPGFSTQQRALGLQTADVGMVEGRSPDGRLGLRTADAVVNGIALALVALVDRAQVELQSRVADTCCVVLTGGDADVLEPLLRGPVIKDDDLLFRGLWAMVMPGIPLHCPTPTG